MTRVLFATDGSELAIGAARRAAAMLADFDATVLAVVPPPVVAPGSAVAGIEGVALPVTSPEAVTEIEASMTTEAEAGVERTVAVLVRAGDTQRLVMHGDAASEICRVAEEGAYDLVVIGSHGSGFVKRVLLGSVSHHVIHHAPCPVLVVRERDTD